MAETDTRAVALQALDSLIAEAERTGYNRGRVAGYRNGYVDGVRALARKYTKLAPELATALIEEDVVPANQDLVATSEQPFELAERRAIPLSELNLQPWMVGVLAYAGIFTAGDAVDAGSKAYVKANCVSRDLMVWLDRQLLTLDLVRERDPELEGRIFNYWPSRQQF